MNKPVIKYLDCMPVTRGEPAWVYARGELGYCQTPPVRVLSVIEPFAPTFETDRARYEPEPMWELPYPNNRQCQPA